MASSSSSLLVPPLMKEKDLRNWADLPKELTSSILLRLGILDRLLSAQKVCRSWRRVCKDPLMWLKIDMRGFRDQRCIHFDELCRYVVDLSQGGLLEINISNFGSSELLSYIAHRSCNLRSLALEIVCPSLAMKGLVNALEKLPLLETLEISGNYTTLSLKEVGQACPQLRTFKLISTVCMYNLNEYQDEFALGIAESMPELRHLQLLGNIITDIGLNAILDNLPYLEHLDIRMCFNINIVGTLEKRCMERIKDLRRPHDSTADCPFEIIFSSYDLDHLYSDYDDEDYDYDPYDNIYDDEYRYGHDGSHGYVYDYD